MAENTPPKEEAERATESLIAACRDALAEEMACWDFEPAKHPIKQAHDRCVAWLLRASLPSPAPSSTSTEARDCAGVDAEHGWLIEHSGAMPGKSTGRVSWLRLSPKPPLGALDWSFAHDASDALRFARKQDAEAALKHYLGPTRPDWFSKPFSVTEHEWPTVLTREAPAAAPEACWYCAAPAGGSCAKPFDDVPCRRQAAPAAAPAPAEPVPWRSIVAAIRAVDVEARRRGEMFPQTSDEQAEDRAAVRRVAEMVEWYATKGGAVAEKLPGWPRLAATTPQVAAPAGRQELAEEVRRLAREWAYLKGAEENSTENLYPAIKRTEAAFNDALDRLAAQQEAPSPDSLAAVQVGGESTQVLGASPAGTACSVASLPEPEVSALRVPPAGAESGWLLPRSAVNELQVASIERLIDHARRARWVNAVVRKDGKETTYEADWIKHFQEQKR